MSDDDKPVDAGAEMAHALQVAATWLRHVGAPADAVVVVTVLPQASLGVRVAGQPEDDTALPAVEEGDADPAEAAAPFVAHAMNRLPEQTRSGALRRCLPGGGSRLQALLAPAGQELVLRVVGPEREVELARVRLSARAG